MAEAEATKRGRGRPKGPDPDKFLLFLSTLDKYGPLWQKEFRARCPELSRGTVSGYSTHYPHLVEKTPNGFSLTTAGQCYLLILETQQLMNKTISATSRAIKGMAAYMIPIIEAGEKIERVTEYLEKKADIISQRPKFEAIEDLTLRAEAVAADLSGDLHYDCLDPTVVNDDGLGDFLAVRDNEGRKICKRCGLELPEGGLDIYRWKSPRKYRKNALKNERTWSIGTMEQNPEELKAWKEKSETKSLGS